MTKQARRTLAALMGCHGQDHRNDADWDTNTSKNFCEEATCFQPFCEWCAPVAGRGQSKQSPGCAKYWCEKHAP